MMKLVNFLFILLIPFFLLSCDNLAKNEKVNNEYSGDTLISTGYYESGELKGVSYSMNGRFVKDFREYYKNGNLKNLINYRNGLKHGIKEHYYENGQLLIRLIYINDEKRGAHKEFYENGQPKNIGKNDTLFSGKYYEYYESGKLQSEHIMNNSVNIGYSLYKENGEVERSAVIHLENENFSIQTRQDTVALEEDYAIYVVVSDELLRSNSVIILAALNEANEITYKYGEIPIKETTTTIMLPARDKGIDTTEGLISFGEKEIPFRVTIFVE